MKDTSCHVITFFILHASIRGSKSQINVLYAEIKLKVIDKPELLIFDLYRLYFCNNLPIIYTLFNKYKNKI